MSTNLIQNQTQTPNYAARIRMMLRLMGAGLRAHHAASLVTDSYACDRQELIEYLINHHHTSILPGLILPVVGSSHV